MKDLRVPLAHLLTTITKAFGVTIDKKLVRRVPAKHYRPMPDDGGPSWLTFLGQRSKSIPYTPVSHPFVERLIGTIRREYLDHIFFWYAQDLERKLVGFRQYYNRHRVHQSLDGNTPMVISGDPQPLCAKPESFSSL